MRDAGGYVTVSSFAAHFAEHFKSDPSLDVELPPETYSCRGDSSRSYYIYYGSDNLDRTAGPYTVGLYGRTVQSYSEPYG